VCDSQSLRRQLVGFGSCVFAHISHREFKTDGAALFKRSKCAAIITAAAALSHGMQLLISLNASLFRLEIVAGI